MNTIKVDLLNNTALQLLRDLEALHIIRLHVPENKGKIRLSDKYRGVLSKEEGESLNEHVRQMRSEGKIQFSFYSVFCLIPTSINKERMV